MQSRCKMEGRDSEESLPKSVICTLDTTVPTEYGSKGHQYLYFDILDKPNCDKNDFHSLASGPPPAAPCSCFGLEAFKGWKFSKIAELQTNGQTIENHSYGVTDKRTDY